MFKNLCLWYLKKCSLHHKDLFFIEWYEYKEKYNKLKKATELDPNINYKSTIVQLEQKINRQKNEIRNSQQALQDRNQTIRSLGYIVYCTGCWAGGPYNKRDITEEDVKTVEHIAKRLRTWFDNMVYRKKNGSDEEYFK